MKRILLTLAVLVASLQFPAFDSSAQNTADVRSEKRQKVVDDWHKDMAAFRARTEHDRQLRELADSIAGIQAGAALRNKDFVLQADYVSFKNGMSTFVDNSTTFISVKGNRAVVQISPSNFSSGPNGLGGVTVDGMVSDYKVMTDNKGRIILSMNVMGIGINAQVEIYMYPGSNSAQATVYPNFNSNTVWLSGNIVPYENATVMEGSSL